MDFLSSFIPSEETFLKMAEKLMANYAIASHGKFYRLMEIEFYWHEDQHGDKSTYGRHHTDPQSGQWFFHYSGVDIALRNERGYGGILIRSIAREDCMKKLIRGPMVVAMVLFSGYNVFDGLDTKLVERPLQSKNFSIKATPRVGLGKNARESGFEDKHYRFLLILPSGSGQDSRLSGSMPPPK